MGAESNIVVFSDIHSNLEALQAVVNDMRNLTFSQRICLGDIVGYAASPKECLELVRSLNCKILKGNHDHVVVDNPTALEMSAAAALGIRYARKRLSTAEANFLASLPMTAADEGHQFVHSSLDRPEAWIYLTREPEMREHFKGQSLPVAFCGHTHIPAVVWMSSANGVKVLGQRGRIELPDGGKILVNVGAVGQPRDRCSDACYVIYDSTARILEFRRVPYDVKSTQRKILEAQLPKVTGDRLSVGK